MNRARFLLVLVFVVLTFSACSTHRSLTVSADGTVSCTRSRDVSEHLGGLASLLTPFRGTTALAPRAEEEESVPKSLTPDLTQRQAAVMEAEAEARKAEAEARSEEAKALKATVEACAQIMGS